MIVGNELPIVQILTVYLRRYVLTFLGAAVVAWVLVDGLGWTWLAMPALPLSVVGVALAIFLGFRTNSAYDRYWEARKLWGRMVNVSRHFTHQVEAYVHPPPKATKAVQAEAAALAAELIGRQAVYVHALRCHCRTQSVLDDIEVQRLADGSELEALRGSTNMPATLIGRQHTRLAEAARDKWITPQQLESFDTSLHEMLNVQGGCERILKTPIPVAYVYFSRRLVILFGCALPLGFVESAGWYTLIVAPVAAMFFFFIDTIGRLIENPFSTGFYGLPLSALSITIEQNIRQHLPGDPELPPSVQPAGPTGHVLM